VIRSLAPVAVAGLVVLGVVSTAAADIDIELRPVSSIVTLGEQVEIGVYLVSDDATTQYSSAADIILNWETSYLDYAGLMDTGAHPLLSSGFPIAHPSQLNTTLTDGDGMYTAFAVFNDDIPATPSGTLITTLLFDTVAITPGTPLNIPVLLGNGETKVFDNITPNFNVLGTATGTMITIIPAPASALLLIFGCGFRYGRRRSV
jgi:hypothetical protein